MEKPSGWAQLYAYIWDDGGNEYSDSSPVALLTAASNGYYSFQASDVEYGYVNVCFSDGGSHASIDILGVDANTYYKSSGAYPADSSKVLLQSGVTANIPAPNFRASEVTDSTVTLTWDPIPGVDGYILYDQWVDYDDNDEEIPDSEYWHFQKVLCQASAASMMTITGIP
ncbi:MAG: starch-binding protein [Treponema sp.]|jgi:hypothetical protein|nr:starch-binding protein [Treponema sp.]